MSNRLTRTESLRGGVLFVDAAGFTPLCVSLASGGQAGITALQEIMSRYYSGLLDFLREFGGVVYQFAGDSVLVGLPQAEGEDDQATALRVARCAHEIHSAAENFREFTALGESHTIQTKVGAAFGDYHVVLLGERTAWLYPALLGPAVRLAVAAEVRAEAGQTILAPGLASALPPDQLETRGLSSPAGRDADLFLELLHLRAPVAGAQRSFTQAFRLPADHDPEKLYRRSARFLPEPLLKKITTGHRGFTGDLRHTSCLFIRCDGLTELTENRTDASGAPAGLARDLSEFYRFIQAESIAAGGMFLQADFSDKGGMFLILFGAPTALEHKEAAAARLALRVRDATGQFAGISHLQVGIATGDAYCGNVGAPFRKSYSILGENVNLAARLASYRPPQNTAQIDGAAETSSIPVGRPRILIDSATRSRLHATTQTGDLPPARLKGITGEVALAEILSETDSPTQSAVAEIRGEMIGRRAELDLLHGYLEQAAGKTGRLALLVGEAGMGKSRLINEFLPSLTHAGFCLLGGHCLSYEQRTPLFPWKELLRRLLQLDTLTESKAVLDRIRSRLAVLAERRSDQAISPNWAPVFANLLGHAVRETPLTRALEAREKNLRLSQIIFALIADAANEQPLCLFFEDAHWMDETSLRLIEFLSERIASLPVLLLISSRPDDRLNELRKLIGTRLEQGSAALMELARLNEADALSFVRHRLALSQANPDLEATILNVAQGNPFFIESIVESLIEQQHIQSDGAGRQLVTAINRIQLPTSLRDVLLARLDGLDENAQTTLKTASVIGRIFDFKMLQSILPDTLSSDRARDSLRDLERVELTLLENDLPLEYIFKHVAIRDVAYESMLLSTREFLHRAVARELEAQHADNLRDRADILAYHFRAGAARPEALRYSMMAALKAMENYANGDAIAYFEQAAELLADASDGEDIQLRVEIKQNLAELRSRIGEYPAAMAGYNECLELVDTPTHRAQLHLGIGRIHQERGEGRAAVAEMETAMRILGKRAPRTKAGTIASLVWQFIVRFACEKLPFLVRRWPRSEIRRGISLLRALRVLTKTYFFVDLERFAWGGAYGINLAERVGEPGELAQLQAAYGMIMNGLGNRQAAARYLDTARKLASENRGRYPLGEGLVLQLNGTLHMFWDNPAAGLADLDESIRICRSAGGMWELLTSLGTQGQLLFLLSRFQESAEKYAECGELARELNSTVHMGWKHCKASFCRYLISRPTPELRSSVRAELFEAIALSIQAEDLMNHLIATAHLAVIARHEGDAAEAARLAVEILEINRRYKVNVPHVKIALVDAADAALFAAATLSARNEDAPHAGSIGLSHSELLKIAASAIQKARALGKTFPYLRGPAERARARYVQLTKGADAARPVFERAIKLLDQTPHLWERGQAYAAAAGALPQSDPEHSQLLTKAAEIFRSADIQAELALLPTIGPEQHASPVPVG